MDWLVWTGTALTLIGIGGLGWCIRDAIRARRQETDDDALKTRLQRVVAMNLGALAVSALGLMAVVMGVLLG